MQFTELTRVAPEILQATQAMGFTEMTEIQEKAIPLMLDGHDMIAKAPTGTGKTFLFGGFSCIIYICGPFDRPYEGRDP